jgi:hypothetical protein
VAVKKEKVTAVKNRNISSEMFFIFIGTSLNIDDIL